MVQLLNRFAWFLCIGIALIPCFFFTSDEEFWLFLWIIVGIIVKTLFFSEKYIRWRVEFFAKQIEKRVSWSPLTQAADEPWFQKNNIETSDTPLVLHTDTTNPDIHGITWEQESDIPKKEEKNVWESSIAYNMEKRKEKDIFQYHFNISEVLWKFFGENIIAKVGGVIVFIGVFFLLTVIYAQIGPVMKMIGGFIIGFLCFYAGMFLDKKWLRNESRIVMGTAILINYLVILGGRYLLWGESETGNLLPVSITFLFLILNTIFAVSASLVYKSHTLLIFSFIFAYINPLLLGTHSDDPYTLLGYTMIVTLWAMYMSHTRKDIILFTLSFILWAFLLLIAPSQDTDGWIVKLLCVNILWVLSLVVSTVFEKRYQYFVEFLIAGIFFLIGFFWFFGFMQLSTIQLTILGISSLGLMLYCYISMGRWVYLYSIGTLGTILTLSPALTFSPQKEQLFLSTLIIGFFALSNIWIILQKNKKLISENIGNILMGLISGAIFLSYMVYTYGNIYFPGIVQGFAFWALAAIYSLVGIMLMQQIGIEEIKSEEKYKNIFYALAAIGISLFSLGIAFVFAEQKDIIALVWTLESSILFFFAQKTKALKIAIGAGVLFIIGVLRMLPFIESPLSHNYGLLVSCVLFVLCLWINLFYILPQGTQKSFLPIEYFVIHHIFHIIGMITALFISLSILDFQDIWFWLLYVSSILALLWYVYTLLGSKWLQRVHLAGYIISLWVHIILFSWAIEYPSSMNLWVSFLIAGIYALPFIAGYMRKKSIENTPLFSLFLFYIFILSSLTVYFIFESTFSVTLYWGALTFSILWYGISKDVLFIRTIGLYLLVLTVGKIFLFDIWDESVGDGVGFMVFIATWILMIILSTMYTKKFGNTLNNEFNLKNLFPKQNLPKEGAEEEISEKEIAEKNMKKSSIQEDIEKTVIEGEIIWVRMFINGTDKPVQIRAKNLLKIAKLIENTHHKNEFSPGELSDIYTLVTQNYKSTLPAEQYKKIEEIVAQFVKYGGKMEFVKN